MNCTSRRETKQALRGRRSTCPPAQGLERVDGGGKSADGMDKIVVWMVGGGQDLGACHASEVELEWRLEGKHVVTGTNQQDCK